MLRNLEGNEAQVGFFIIQLLLLRNPEFRNRVVDFVKEVGRCFQLIKSSVPVARLLVNILSSAQGILTGLKCSYRLLSTYLSFLRADYIAVSEIQQWLSELSSQVSLIMYDAIGISMLYV